MGTKPQKPRYRHGGARRRAINRSMGRDPRMPLEWPDGRYESPFQRCARTMLEDYMQFEYNRKPLLDDAGNPVFDAFGRPKFKPLDPLEYGYKEVTSFTMAKTNREEHLLSMQIDKGLVWLSRAYFDSVWDYLFKQEHDGDEHSPDAIRTRKSRINVWLSKHYPDHNWLDDSPRMQRMRAEAKEAIELNKRKVTDTLFRKLKTERAIVGPKNSHYFFFSPDVCRGVGMEHAWEEHLRRGKLWYNMTYFTDDIGKPLFAHVPGRMRNPEEEMWVEVYDDYLAKTPLFDMMTVVSVGAKVGLFEFENFPEERVRNRISRWVRGGYAGKVSTHLYTAHAFDINRPVEARRWNRFTDWFAEFLWERAVYKIVPVANVSAEAAASLCTFRRRDVIEWLEHDEQVRHYKVVTPQAVSMRLKAAAEVKGPERMITQVYPGTYALTYHMLTYFRPYATTELLGEVFQCTMMDKYGA